MTKLHDYYDPNSARERLRNENRLPIPPRLPAVRPLNEIIPNEALQEVGMRVMGECGPCSGSGKRHSIFDDCNCEPLCEELGICGCCEGQRFHECPWPK